MHDHFEAHANRTVVERYFAPMNSGRFDVTFIDCLAPDAIQEELPNRLLPNGARRDMAALREAAAKCRARADQHFDVRRMLAEESTVIVEPLWTRTVRSDAGALKAGTVLRAHFAQFFELREGEIVAIRNYDCFDPW